jgi:hypothetical protein
LRWLLDCRETGSFARRAFELSRLCGQLRHSIPLKSLLPQDLPGGYQFANRTLPIGSCGCSGNGQQAVDSVDANKMTRKRISFPKVKSELASLKSVCAGRYRAPSIKLFDFRKAALAGNLDRGIRDDKSQRLHFSLSQQTGIRKTSASQHTTQELILAYFIGVNATVGSPRMTSVCRSMATNWR